MESDEDLGVDQDDTQEVLLPPMITRNVTRLQQRNQSPLKRYMTSSTAKRKQIKQSHCKFCESNIPASSLIDHLKRERNKRCFFFYSKMYQVTTFESLVAKLFSCEMCYNQERIDFRKHLKKNRGCLAKFRKKFQVEDIGKIQMKMMAIKRKTFPSRSNQYGKTISQFLNEYRENVSLGNFKLCVQCHSNFRKYGAKVITENDEMFERLKLSSEENKTLRRFEAYYICNSCLKAEEDSKNNEELKCNLSLYEEHENVAFFPSTEALSEAGMAITKRHVKIWYPYTIDAVEESSKFNDNKLKIESVSNMYKTEDVDTSDISSLYHVEYKKYQSIKEKNNLYTGIIDSSTTRRVINIQEITNCSKIAGSKDWFNVHATRMKDWQEQLGLIHATILIDLPMDSPDIIATALIQKGIPVTIEKRGLGNGELELLYKVHLDHKSDTDCSSDCVNIVSLEEYITTTGFHIDEASYEYIGTYVSSCHEKIISFTRSIIEAPASGLFSEDYQLYLSFDDRGKASILGCFWPHDLKDVNENIALTNGDLSVYEEELVRFIDQNISCSGDPRFLRTRFNISESEANDLSDIVLSKQFHKICTEIETCEYCSCPPFPSMETIVKQNCTGKNYEASKVLLGRIRLKLKSLSLEERENLKTWNFLQDIWTNVDGEISENGELLILTFESEDDDLEFEVNDVLTKYLGKYKDSPKTGVYHYALSCFGYGDGSSIVLQRLWIVDTCILPFNPLHLKANKSTTVISIGTDSNLFGKLFLPRNGHNTHIEAMNPATPLTHRLISLAEAIAISDSKIKMVQSSTKEQYVNAKEKRSVLLKKAKDDVDSPFICDENDERYELLVDPISRHFNRSNTSDGILLVETCSWFDYVGEEKSKELSETYRNCEIPRSNEPSVCSNENLPEYILCTNGDVLKKRKKRKIVIVPSTKTKREEMYLKSLLYLPIRSEQELQGPDCTARFEEVNRDKQALVVELNEKRMFPKKMLELSRVDLLDDLLEALEEVSDYEENEDEL